MNECQSQCEPLSYVKSCERQACELRFNFLIPPAPPLVPVIGDYSSGIEGLTVTRTSLGVYACSFKSNCSIDISKLPVTSTGFIYLGGVLLPVTIIITLSNFVTSFNAMACEYTWSISFNVIVSLLAVLTDVNGSVSVCLWWSSKDTTVKRLFYCIFQCGLTAAGKVKNDPHIILFKEKFMLEAYVSFAGPTGQVCNYMGNECAIEAPTITRTGMGQYTVTFLTGRKIDATKIASSIITVECQSPTGTGTVTNVTPSPVAVFNPNATKYPWQVSFQIETQNVVQALPVGGGTVLSFVDRPVVMISLWAKNEILRLVPVVEGLQESDDG